MNNNIKYILFIVFPEIIILIGNISFILKKNYNIKENNHNNNNKNDNSNSNFNDL